MQTRTLFVLSLVAVVGAGCVGSPASDEELGPAHAAEVELASSELRGCDTRWSPAPQALSAGARAYVPYEGAGRSCSGGATAGAIELSRYLKRNFAGQIDRSIAGNGVQIFNCRRVRSGRSLSLHAVGRALDIFIPTRGGAADNAKGDLIANWLVANAENIGIQYVIWDRTRWMASGSRRNRCYGGSNAHSNHIHVELSRAAAAKRTPFFRNGTFSAPAEPQPAAPAQPDRSDTPAESRPDPMAGAGGWIGDACLSAADCAFGSAQCLMDHSPASGLGICVQQCAGYCPDRSGTATTFCVPREAVGAAGLGGICLAKAHVRNKRCAERADLIPLEVERHVGRSGARHAYATICGPQEAVAAPIADGPAASAPAPAAPRPQMCGGAGVEMSNNGDDCAGTPENTWRCACSARFDTTISQVCRDGAWLTFHTSPRNCGACSGWYTSACD